MLLIFIFKFGRNKWCYLVAFYLHFICFSSEKSRAFPIPPHFYFLPSFAGEPGEKKVCLEREEAIFPLLFNYFVTSLLLVGTLLHSLLPPIGMIQMRRKVNFQV